MLSAEARATPRSEFRQAVITVPVVVRFNLVQRKSDGQPFGFLPVAFDTEIYGSGPDDARGNEAPSIGRHRLGHHCDEVIFREPAHYWPGVVAKGLKVVLIRPGTVAPQLPRGI